MEEHPIQGLMTTAMESLQSLVETNTIIGDAIETPDGGIMIPVSKVGFGFAAGGSEFNSQSSESDATLPFGGGSGGGVSLTPIAFLWIKKDDVKLVRLDQNSQLYEKFLELTPSVIEKVENIMKEKGSKRNEGENDKEKDKDRAKDNNKEEEKNQNPINFDL